MPKKYTVTSEPISPADPDTRIAALHARVRQREESIASTLAAAERAKQRAAEQRRDCIAHAEMLAERAKGLNGIETAPGIKANVFTDTATTRLVCVGARLLHDHTYVKWISRFIIAYTPGSDGEEEPSYWLPPAAAAISEAIIEHSRRVTFTEALDLMITSVEEALDAGGGPGEAEVECPF